MKIRGCFRWFDKLMVKMNAAVLVRIDEQLQRRLELQDKSVLKEISALLEEQNIRQQEQLNSLEEQIEGLKGAQEKSDRVENEILFGNLFSNAIANSYWLKNQSFAPGRWAVGYPYLYAAYRILNETEPDRILELGLGQSTRLYAQYAATHETCSHTVVEHDEEWIDFWKKGGITLSERTNLVKLPIISGKFRGKPLVMYDNFVPSLQGRKFDLISIDAPFGGADNVYSRVDILELIPDCLAESFVILVDDCNRTGELNMVKVLMKKLKEKEIPFKKAKYCGTKDVYLVVSEDLKFLCTL